MALLLEPLEYSTAAVPNFWEIVDHRICSWFCCGWIPQCTAAGGHGHGAMTSSQTGPILEQLGEGGHTVANGTREEHEKLRLPAGISWFADHLLGTYGP